MKPNLMTLSRSHVGGAWVQKTDVELLDPATCLPVSLLRNNHTLNLPEVSEIDVVRYFTALSEESHGVDNGSYPLGSCTMKYNPKQHERYANFDGFRQIHPEQNVEDVQGYLALLHQLQNDVAELTGMNSVSIQPAAGAQGELAGLLIMRKYFHLRDEKRDKILIADSAHGTNPSSAAMAGYKCKIIPTTAQGLMDLDVLNSEMDETVAGLMLTNPSTVGLFESNIVEIAERVHKSGGLLYYDGANLNALMGLVRPGDMGFDIVHINTHKTLATPHGGGGPGAGPVGVKSYLADFLPTPLIAREGNIYKVISPEKSIGRLKQHMGHLGVLIKAYAYIRTMGPDGLKQASEDAVLNANYLQHHLREILPPVYNKTCMHECLLSGDLLPVSSFRFAKRMIDHKMHPPTLVGAGCVYFPDGLKNAMLVEPTETESKSTLDNIISTFEKIYSEFSAVEGVANQSAPKIRVKNSLGQSAITTC